VLAWLNDALDLSLSAMSQVRCLSRQSLLGSLSKIDVLAILILNNHHIQLRVHAQVQNGGVACQMLDRMHPGAVVALEAVLITCLCSKGVW